MNINPAISTNFLLEIPLFPELNYFIQTTEVPGITMAGVDLPYKNIYGNVPSNRIDYDQLNVTFLVDEDWTNWHSLVRWMARIKTGKDTILTEMCDMTLHLKNSNKTLGKRLLFCGGYPVSLGTLNLESSTTDATNLVCSASFKYQHYDMLTHT